MSKFVIRHLTLAMLSLTLAAAPVASVVYAAPDANPPPPPARSKIDNTTPSSVDDRNMPRPDTKNKKKKSSEVRPGTQETAFATGYRAAYATIYERHDYTSAIEQLKALGHDDSAAVANLIGYSYRQLGDYKVSQVWYERALKADPNHVKTWQYYGLWQVEQGNRDQAQYHLNKIAALAGTSSEEYRSLAAALEKPPGTGLVY
jgi:tetratricopeptide (TPR) repeat protein